MEAIDGPGAERLVVPCRSRASVVCGTPGVLPAAALFFALVFGIGRGRARPDNGRARGDDKTTRGTDPEAEVSSEGGFQRTTLPVLVEF